MTKLSATVVASVLTLLYSSVAAPVDDARQLLVVTPAGWQDLSAELVCYERASNNLPWRQVASNIVVIGRSGLGWGLGLHETNNFAGPVKQEGDGRSPAGIFRLSAAFGYAPSNSMTWLKMPYRQCTGLLECVDDPQSTHYNAILERSAVSDPNWKSSEQMRRHDDLYSLGLFVDHNQHPAIPGRGSCIFIHIWEGPGHGTSGCTAMSADRLETLMRWLDASKNPLLIQLPRSEYLRLMGPWKLPESP